MEENSQPLTNVMGPALTVAILLRDWEKYALAERVCYHFDLTDALPVVGRERLSVNATRGNQDSNAIHSVCGVSCLLECIPTAQGQQLTKHHRRALRAAMLRFNAMAVNAMRARQVYCHEPPLPLRLNPASRVFFTYETTRIAFCLDASSSLTNTFGFTRSDTVGKACCPLDRLVEMAKVFFTALIKPISAPGASVTGLWKPHLTVSVLAVFPSQTGTPEIRQLVRDFHVSDAEHAEILVKHIQDWALGEVESQIAYRLAQCKLKIGRNPYDAFMIPTQRSSLQDILSAADASLDTMSSAARPCIVVASDGCSVASRWIVDLLSDKSREDIPVSLLDLSSPLTHVANTALEGDTLNLLLSDPKGDTMPLHLSDDTDMLHSVCRATGGAFWDGKLLTEAAQTLAGEVAAESPLVVDHFFSFPRHSMKPNAIQWYTLFALSPLSPRTNSSWGRLPPPEYVLRSTTTPQDIRGISPKISTQRLTQQHIRTTISSYIVNPIPIKGLILTRVKEGYRAKQYGQSTIEVGKVSMQFTLPLEMGVTVLYELSFRSPSGQSSVFGFAHIKVELSGEPALIQLVKTDFMRAPHPRPATFYNQVSDRICHLLRSMRKEDMLQSYISPEKWTDQLTAPDTPFVKRLASLTDLQRSRHYRFDEFDCVCVGNMPYECGDDDDFLSQFRNTDDGSEGMVEAMQMWSSQMIADKMFFVKKIERSSEYAPPSYCIVQLKQTPGASRLWTISVETLCGTDAGDRLLLLSCLRSLLDELHNVSSLKIQMGKFLVGQSCSEESRDRSTREIIMEKQYNHASWDLVMDPELLPLLMKRRREIGKFLLLGSSHDEAIFAKIASKGEHTNDPGTLVQYKLAIQGDRVAVDLYMENKAGEFTTGKTPLQKKTSQFHTLQKTLRKRDQECGLALQSRTGLLRLFDSREAFVCNEHISYAERLLDYCSTSILQLRFFHPCTSGANIKLVQLTESMLVSQDFGPRVIKLDLGESILLNSKGPGDWFLVEHNSDTMSLLHLSHLFKSQSSTESNDVKFVSDLSFYTVGVGDLYSKRDDIADDASDDDHISEHLCVTEFTELIEAHHRFNYASAAFQWVVSTNSKVEFNVDDLEYVMSHLKFIEVAKVVVAGDTTDGTTTSKLPDLLYTVLTPVESNGTCFAYRSPAPNDVLFQLDDDSSVGDSCNADGRATISARVEDDETSAQGTLSLTINDNPAEEEVSIQSESSVGKVFSDNAGKIPLFVKFLVDGKPATIGDIAVISCSSTICVLLSIFDDTSHRASTEARRSKLDLSSAQSNAAAKINSLLSSYVAEQTLERLRHSYANIDEENLYLARKCLRMARHSLLSAIDVFFYVSKTDSMVPASAPAGNSAEIEEGFKLLTDQFFRNNQYTLKTFGDDSSYFVLDLATELPVLPFFCFLKLRKSRGILSVEIYHPDGLDQGAQILERINEMVLQSCHRTNQILLLRRLHRSRMANALLIPDDPDSDTKSASQLQENSPFPPGIYRCPVHFRATFDLFHRCSTNPTQVARTLEATVLHIFSISNRRRVFVYKDEDGSVFYMRLSTQGGGVESDGTIELRVHGVDVPGPSVTKQLSSLLQRRLHLIAIDVLSSLLTKNPRFVWKPADVRFVKSFKEEWMSLDENATRDERSNIRDYLFPQHLIDPSMMLVYFRQNICGSTFFHPLIAERQMNKDDSDNVPTSSFLNDLALTFYYNNATSNLNPAFQAHSTLTQKGLEYSRQAGTGLAIVEVALVDAHGRKLPEIRAISQNHSTPITDIKSLRLKERDCTSDDKGIVIRVTITAASLKCDVLQDWVKLTIEQELASLAMETAIKCQEYSSNPDVSTSLNNEAIENTLGGLRAFENLIEESCRLPHPAVLRYSYDGVVRSSMVADLAVDLLEGVVLDQLRLGNIKSLRESQRSNILIIRLSRGEAPKIVDLSREPGSGKTVVLPINIPSEAVRDSPIDCPEYVIYYRAFNSSGSPPKLFEEVAIDDGTGDVDVLAYLHALRIASPESFTRSFAFIYLVKRTFRTLLTYNWDAQLFNKVAARLEEKESQTLLQTKQSAGSLQRRSLKLLSPVMDSTGGVKKKEVPLKVGETINDIDNERTAVQNPSRAVSNRGFHEGKDGNDRRDRSVTRPTSIRRPKLIGKSVDGAAFHAVAASRARASSHAFRGTLAGSSNLGQSRKPSEPIRKPSSSRSPSIPVVTNRSVQRSQNKGSSFLHKFYESYVGTGQGRVHTDHSKVTRHLNASFWLAKSSDTVSPVIADAILQENSQAWYDTSQMLPLPGKLSETFVASFTAELTQRTSREDLSIVPMENQSQASISIILTSGSRAVHQSRCVPVAKLSVLNMERGKLKSSMLAVEASILSLPRRKNDRRFSLKRRRYYSLELMEHDASGSDILACKLANLLKLETVIFDHAASVAERAMKSVNGELSYGEVLCLTRDLIAEYSLTQQRLILRSNYKCFLAKIALRSYKDALISKYNGPVLFQWLCSNIVGRTVLICGDEGLCFKKEIVVRGTHSICFLTLDPTSIETLCLVVLCRTQGRNLHEYMFRDGSHVAISVVDNIAVECAQLAFDELRLAARILHRDNLWFQLSHGEPLRRPSKSIIEELISLCEVKPATEYFTSPSDFQRFGMVCSLVRSWEFCVNLLDKEAEFSPSWNLGSSRRMFFCRSEDIFFIVKEGEHDYPLDIDIVKKGEIFINRRSKGAFVLQKLFNYVLHCLWNDMTSL